MSAGDCVCYYGKVIGQTVMGWMEDGCLEGGRMYGCWLKERMDVRRDGWKGERGLKGGKRQDIRTMEGSRINEEEEVE